jgi:hypothetical protein
MDYRKRFIIEPGTKVSLSKIDPSYTGKHESHRKAAPEILKHVERMCRLQYRFTQMAINPFSSYCRRLTPPAKMASFGTYSVE